MNPTDTASQTIDIQTADVYKTIFTGRRSEIIWYSGQKLKKKQWQLMVLPIMALRVV